MAEEKKEEQTQAEAPENTEEKKEETKEVEVPEKFQKLVSEIEQMTVLDLAEFVKILEEKFGVSAAAPQMMMQGGGARDAEEEKEEKTEFDVELSDAGSNKIAVIKAVRVITEMGLKDAKDLVDGAPKVIKEAAKKEEADEIKAQIEEAGGKVTLK
ncbi:50S ribosomal protein L7/L12 [Patescibacteria group bacterium]|nr:50S ribosomal protein L7/L12 [Patescibacteria group bacterium]